PAPTSYLHSAAHKASRRGRQIKTETERTDVYQQMLSTAGRKGRPCDGEKRCSRLMLPRPPNKDAGGYTGRIRPEGRRGTGGRTRIQTPALRTGYRSVRATA